MENCVESYKSRNRELHGHFPMNQQKPVWVQLSPWTSRKTRTPHPLPQSLMLIFLNSWSWPPSLSKRTCMCPELGGKKVKCMNQDLNLPIVKANGLNTGWGRASHLLIGKPTHGQASWVFVTPYLINWVLMESKQSRRVPRGPEYTYLLNPQ